MNKKTIWIGSVIAAVAVIVLLLLANIWLDKYSNHVAGIIREQIQKALPPGTTVGSVDFYLLTSTVKIQNIRIPNPAGGQKKNAVYIQSMIAELNISGLADKVIHFKKLHVNDCKVSLDLHLTPEDLENLTNLEWTLFHKNNLRSLFGRLFDKTNQKKDTARQKWYIQIDELKISGTSVALELGALADAVDPVFDRLVKQIPEKYARNKIVNFAIEKARKPAVDWIKDQIRALGDLKFILPDYTQKNIGKVEVTEFNKIAAEIAMERTGILMDGVASAIIKTAKLILEKYDAIADEIEKWTAEKCIQKIVYHETGPHGPTERYVIDFTEGIYTYECSKTAWELGKDGYEKRNLTLESVAQIRKNLVGFTARNWKDRYCNPMICDGTFWGMEICFSDGSIRKISGANAWPRDFSRRFQFGVDPHTIVTDAIKKAVKE